MTKKGLLQGGEEIEALFAQRRQVSAKAAKDLGSSGCAEAARHLLLHFEHANIAFGQVVIKWHCEVIDKRHDLGLVVSQTIQEIPGRGLFETAPLIGLAYRRWISPLAKFDNSVVDVLKSSQL